MKTHLYLPLLASAALLCALPSTADEIKLKSGQTLSGRITYESDEMVKMEVAISASIKETKILARDEIESIVKDAPDDVEFAKIQQLVPTGSMISAENYRTMLGTPEAFLKSFPGSKHTAKVTEIRDTLAKELDLVERGHIKVDGDWYSPQDKIDFKELIDSRIRLVRMQGYSQGGNLNNYIAAMREYEVIEKRYNGSPAFPKAVELALQVVPKLGQQLQTLASNVDYHTAEYDKALAASTPEAREKLVAARAREDQSFVDSIAKDKKEGIKWTQLNPRNKQAIEDYRKFAGNEMGRLRAFNLEQLAAQAELLVAADKLIAENKIGEARTKLGEAAALTGQTTKLADSPSSKKSKGKSAAAAPAGSYLAALNNKINAKLNEEKEKEKERVAASKSEALTNKLKAGTASEEATDTAEAPEEPTTDEAAETDAAEKAAPKKPASGDDDLAALTSSKKSAPKKEAEGEKSKAKAKPKKKAADDDGDNSDGEKKPKRPAVIEDEEEGGFSFKWIVWGLTGLVVVALVVMKVLGIGGKKGGEE